MLGLPTSDLGDKMNWYLLALKKYADFATRSRRSEYWFFVLFNIIAAIVLSIIDSVTGLASAEYGGLGPFYGLYALAVLIPSIAVGVRRLHDIGKSGWWLLLAFIPLIGAIVLIIWFVKDSEAGTNRFGPNPKEVGSATAAAAAAEV